MTRLTRKYLLWLALCTAPLLAAYIAIAALSRSDAYATPGIGWALLALAGAGFAALIVLSVVLARKLLQPLNQIAASLATPAELGMLPPGSEAEIGAVAEAISELHTQLAEMTLSRDYLDQLLESISDAILVTDTEGSITRVNNAAADLLAYPANELIGRPISQLIDLELASKTRPGEPAARSSDGTFLRRDGATLPVSYTVAELRSRDGQLEGWIVAAQNSAERRRAENRIKFLARTDPLTKISNRMQFQHQLQQSIARARRAHTCMALLYMDIDRFKDINDTLGHSAGDRALEIFAQRIVAQLPESAIAGRLAGDEFAVLLSDFSTLGDAIDEIAVIANALLKAVGRPFRMEAQEIFVTSSMGVAIYPRDADNVIDLLRNADAALYQAKRAGGNCYERYSEDMKSAAVDRLMLKSKLRRAFERDELRLHYQPKYHLATGRIAGAEALVRWDLPERGLVFPADFIPIAEESNLILQLGDWVFNQVCEDYRYWQRSLAAPERVSLNLSLKQLQQHRFLEKVQGTFRAHGVSPTCLELEITETTLMDDAQRTVRLLNALYSMGLHLTIDDFGTGYSSLSALQQFPITTLKIDQSFVRDAAIDKEDAAIVRAIIQMGHTLNLEIVAEGVESEQQMELLRRHGCDYVQGHLFGDPMTAEELLHLLLGQAGGGAQHRQLFA
jgi:diguanylate cyclase (GGDEF)-like protein/PAS domain S-box-containing protein